MNRQGADPMFVLSWAYSDEDKPAGQIKCKQDFLAAIENADQDRGDRSYHRELELFTFIGEVWRLADVAFFHVSINAETYPDEAVEWLQGRGWEDKETQKGYSITFLFKNRKSPVTVGSLVPTKKLKYLNFGKDCWMIGPQWAINLSHVIHFGQAYGDFDILAEN